MSIRLVGKTGSVVDDATYSGGACFALELVDANDKPIPASFSIDYSGDIPMAAITPYGMLVVLVSSADLNKSLAITATPIDGSSATTVNKTILALIGSTVPSNL